MRNCCCFSLKTGGMIIGWIGMVGVIASLCVLIPTLNNVNSTISFGESPYHSLMNVDVPSQTAQTLTAVSIGDQVIQLVMNLALMYGICKTNNMYLVPWLLMNMLQLIVIAIVSLILVFTFKAPIMLFIAAIFLSVYLYLWMSVLSLFYQLRQENLTNPLRAGAISVVPLLANVTSMASQHSLPPYVRIEGDKI